MKHVIGCLLFLLPLYTSAQRLAKLGEELVFHNAPFQQCHASTLLEMPGRGLMLACFGGAHEGNKDVSVWVTQLKNNTWSQPEKLAEGYTNDSTRYPCWNPVLFRSFKGEISLFYKIGPNPREWWGMRKVSKDNGLTWSAAETLPKGILGPIKNKPLQLKDGIILSPSSVEVTENRWQAYIERSADGGRSWQLIPIDTASPFKVIQPSILSYPGNKLQVLCRSNQNSVVSAWSTDNGLHWSKLDTTTLPNPNSGTDAVTLKSGWQLIVYNPTTQGKEWFNSRGRLAVAVSRNGRDWQQVLVLEEGNDTNEYSYPAVIQTSDGKIHITYTYNRKNIKHVTLKEQ